MTIDERMELIDSALVTLEGLEYGTQEYRNLYNATYELCTVVLDEEDRAYSRAEWRAVYSLYNELDTLNSVKYREYAMADFLEYKSHMNEPDFDWGFYSDWHKDIYGYRPR